MARDTTELFPAQAEIDRYVDRWSRAGLAEPILAGRGPQRYRATGALLTFSTTNPSLIASFSTGQTITGDTEADRLFLELKIERINSNWFQHPDGSYTFLVELGTSYYSEEVLQGRMSQVASALQDPKIEPIDDGVWTWRDRPLRDTGSDDAVAQIDFRFGWYDCSSGCGFFHSLRAVVSATGPAVVYDLGGDPLPDDLRLSPDTLPPP